MTGFRASAGSELGPTTPPDAQAREFTNTLQMKFVRMEAGSFDMGSPQSERGRYDDETPHHVVITRPFMMGVTPVTQAQWTELMVWTSDRRSTVR